MIEKRPSYEEINYTIRPAKCVERRMLCEAFAKLSAFGELASYRYVGFGSTYFSDFSLLHRHLNMTNMVSIEKDADNAARFEFNRPFRCITMKYGDSSAMLPTLDWNLRTIAWLDYDYRLVRDVLKDIRLVCLSAVPGTAFVVTVDAKPAKLEVMPSEDPGGATARFRQERLLEDIGEDRVPRDLDPTTLGEWGTARIYWRIIMNEIKDALLARNGVRPPENAIQYRQLFNFHYADGARMLSVGGLLYEKGQAALVAGCGFESLPYVRGGEEPFEIRVPCLTLREVRHLDKQIPNPVAGGPLGDGIRGEDLEAYLKLYRYYPAFTEAEL